MTHEDRIEATKDNLDDAVVEYCCLMRDGYRLTDACRKAHKEMLSAYNAWSDAVTSSEGGNR